MITVNGFSFETGSSNAFYAPENTVMRGMKTVITVKSELEIFRHCETKNFLAEDRDTSSLPPPLLSIFFRYQKFREAQKCSPTKFFGTVRKQFFDGKSWYSLPPLSSIKLFETRDFSKHRRVPLRNDSVLWDKTILTENRPSRPLAYPYYFSLPEIFWNTEVFPNEFFRYCVTKSFRRRNLIHPLSDA